MRQKSVKKSITIPANQALWLKENCINTSRLLQKAIDQEMAAQNVSKKVEEENGSTASSSSKLSIPDKAEAD